MRLIGLDPGIAKIGYSIIENTSEESNIKLIECGIISTPANLPIWQRLSLIRKDLTDLLTAFKPEIAIVELLYFAKNTKTAINVAHARGVILEALSSFGIEKVIEVTPTNVKQTLVGNGRADKIQIQNEVARILGLSEIIQPDDASDAIAICLAYLRMNPRDLGRF